MTWEWLAATALLVALATACTFGECFERVDLALYDAALVSWQRPAGDDIVIVAVDDESLAQVGRWPWPRAVHAALLDRLTRDGARAVGLDILFSEPDAPNPAGDATLAAAMRRNGKVVLPLVATDDAGRPEGGLPPLPALARAARALGYANAETDADGLIRRVLRARLVGGELLPHFALALQSAASGDPVTAPADSADAGREVYIAFAGPPGHFPRVSYADMLRGEVAEGFFRDRIVLVGVTAAGLADTHPAPSARSGPLMSGVEIDANLLDTLHRGIAIGRLPPAAGAALAGLTLVGLMAALRRGSARAGLIWSGLAGVVTLVLSASLLRLGAHWYGPVPALLGCLLAYPVWSWRRLEATQRHLDAELRALAQEPALFEAPPGELPQVDPWERRIAAVRDAAGARRRARRFLSAALDSLPVGVLVCDASRQVVLANGRASDLLGGGRRPLVGQPVQSVLQGLRLPPQVFLHQLLHADAGSMLPRQIEVARDEDHPLLLGLATTEDEAGRLAGLVVCLSDVGELRRAQRVREQTMRFLSHDLRSPLMSIISMIDVMQDPEGQDLFDLARIQQTARRALHLADDVMRLARAEALDPQQFRGVDLAVLASQAAEEVAPLGHQRGIEVEFRSTVPAGGAVCRGDGELLRRALINLLNNAVRHSPDREKVVLGLEEEGSDWLLAVQDRGPGIASEQLPKLFSPYVSSRSRVGEGTGLGLVIVKTVVERHGGSLEVHTAPHQGTRFVVRLTKPDRVPGTGRGS